MNLHSVFRLSRVVLLIGQPLFADIVKQNNTEYLNAGASWVGGIAPTASDVAVWDSTVTSANSSALTNNATWDGIRIASPGGPVTISGAATLTLDGGAATDVNLTSATRDLTFQTPVTMGGAALTDVAAGRTLTFGGTLNITAAGSWSKTGWGTVVYDGAITSGVATTLELQRGTNIFTGKFGGLNFTSTAAGARIYVGRISGDATLIISNGVHEACGVDDQANADFVGVGTWGRLFMEGGSLRVPYLRESINNGNAEITVNNGTLEVTGGGGTGTKSYALMIANNHTDTSTTANYGMGTLTVNGGQALFTNGVIKLASESSASTGFVTVTLNGGVLGLKQFYVGASVQMPKTVTLNGGKLRVTGSGDLFTGAGATNGTLTVNVGNGGAVIDTGSNDVTNGVPLLAAGSGGLAKSGNGTLTLTSVNTYIGKTSVLAGLIRFSGAAATTHPNLAVSASGGLSLRDGVLSTFSPSALSMLYTVSTTTLELDLSPNSSACDVLALPVDAALARVNVVPVIQGTANRAKRPGDYVIMTYAGSTPDISRLAVLDPAPLCTYSFILNTSEKTVTLRIANGSSVSEWIAAGGGAWETDANWSIAPANASGTQVLMGNYALTAPATVTASAPVTLGSLTFDNAQSYTLAGPGFTFNNGVADASLAATSGAHTVTAPLSLIDNLSVTPASSASISLSGAVGGGGVLVKNGNGDLWLTATNTYAGGTVLNQGSIVLAGGTVGSGLVTAQGGSGFRIVGATAVTLSNNVAVASSVTFNTQDRDLTLTGLLDWQGSDRTVTKSGTNELRLTSAANESSARFLVDAGTLRFAKGANYYLACGDRDTIQMQNDNGNARTVVIDSGANLDVEGFYLQNGLSNTVVVQGGTLNMRGGGSYGDACLLRANGTGVDRFVVNGGTVTGGADTWFNIGIRGGNSALGVLTLNGGTTTLGRVSMGVRADVGNFVGNGLLEVNGGRLNVAAFFNWMGDSSITRTNTVVLGNGTPDIAVLRLPATANTTYSTANMPILIFNGGTLELAGLAAYGASSLSDYLYGAKQVLVNAGGARIDTQGLDVTITQPLQAGSTPDGGLTKIGAGRLTLTGACSFTGPTTVSAGTLAIPATYASTGLVVAAGASLSLANGAVQTLTPNWVSLASGVSVTFEALADASTCDRIALPSGAAVGDLSIAVVQAGTSVAASRPGDYVLFTFAGSAPTVSGWTLLNPPANRTCSFEIIANTVVLRIAYAAGASIWTKTGSGGWETSGNWTAAPADAAGTAVRFDDAITAPATVTRAGASTAGSVTFNNLQPYTLAGAALTLANVGDTPATIVAESGVHTLTAALNLTSNAMIQAAVGAAVALNGGVSGSTTLTVQGPGALALPNTAGLAINGLGLVSAATLVVSNSATLNTPVTLGTGGGAFAPAAGQTLDVTSVVNGAGGLTKLGSSFLTLTNANAMYAGTTRISAGTLVLDTLPGGIEFGQGRLTYVGSGAVTAGGYTLETGDDTRAGVLRADGNVTFQGNISAVSGALVKTGPGTVTFTAPGLNVFNAGNGAGASHNVLDIGAYGDSPTTGFSGFNVTDGKVVIGAVGQTNVFNGLLVVGLNTTTNTDAETTGELDVGGGMTTVSDALIIGRSNGYTNTAFSARTSKLKMTGGELSVQTLVLARVLNAAGINTSPEAELDGGLLTASNTVIVGEATGSTGTLKLNGGTLVAPNITCVGGQGNVQFNGGVFRPSVDAQTLQGLTSVKVGANGALFDLSLVNTFTLTQVLTTDGADGGLTKTGAGKLVVNGKQRYAGPTVISSGSLWLPITGGLSNVTVLTVSPGASLLLDTAYVQTVALSGLTLGAAAATPVAVELSFALSGTSNDTFAVNGTVVLGNVALTLLQAGTRDAFVRNGTYTLLTYTGTTPDISGLSVANPILGKRYTFSAAAGYVTLKIEADFTDLTGAVVWKATGGGAWETVGNWSVTPGTGGTGQQVRFDSSITAPAAVLVSGGNVTLGAVYFNNTNAYTLSGSSTVTFDNGVTQAVISAESGVHAITTPMTLANGGLTANSASGAGLTLGGTVSGTGSLVKTGAGDLTVTQANPRTGVTELKAGALELAGGATLGSGAVVVDGGSGMRVIGTNGVTMVNAVTLKTGLPLINTRDSNLTLSGTLDWQSAVSYLYKVGTNTLALAGTGSSVAASIPKMLLREGGLQFASGADYTFDGTTKESLKVGMYANSKTTVAIESGARVVLGGLNMTAETTSTAGNDSLVTQNGGSLELRNTSGDGGAAFSVRDNGTAPATYVMNGGTFTMPQAAWANVGNNGPGRLVVNGGNMTLGRFAGGCQATSNSAAGGSSDITINGGRLEATGSWSWTSDSGARPTTVRVNGGTLALPATRTYGTNPNRWAALRLAGGTLETTGAALDTSATDDYLAGARRVSLDAGGGTVNTKGLNVTIQQNVLGLSPTGGVAKTGSGTLTLAGTNVLWGLVDVQQGTLRAHLTHSDLPAVPLFRYGMDSTANPDLSGNGIALTAGGSGFTSTNRTVTSQALTFNGSGYFTAPHNPYFTNVTDFTVATWILITANVSGSSDSILSTRPGGDRAFELKLTDGNLVRILQYSDATNAWWNEFRTVSGITLGQWTHVAVSLTPQGVAMYLNGVRQLPIRQVVSSGGVLRDYPGSGYYYTGDVCFEPIGKTGGFIIGRPSAGTNPGLKGSLDDLMLFERALSDAEVSALASETPVRPASVRVAWQSTFDQLGGTSLVSVASGSGQIVNGTLAVKEQLSVGDTENEAPGALLSVANLTLGTNIVYACSGNGMINDLTAVTGLLTVNGAGVIDFGRTTANPITRGFTATVMTYGSITGASNFANWTVTGLGRRGYLATVSAANGEVVVSLKATFGTAVILR